MQKKDSFSVENGQSEKEKARVRALAHAFQERIIRKDSITTIKK